MQTNLMQCAAYGLRTDRLTPHPFNLYRIAGSTHMSISQTQPLDMTLSTCPQLIWSTMARPVVYVWSWPPCCSSVSGSWQSSYILHHLYVEQQLFFSDPQSSLPWGAMLSIQWSVLESESDNIKCNTPAPHSHLRPCWVCGVVIVSVNVNVLYIVAKCNFFSVVTWKGIINDLQKCEGFTHFYEILYIMPYLR